MCWFEWNADRRVYRAVLQISLHPIVLADYGTGSLRRHVFFPVNMVDVDAQGNRKFARSGLKHYARAAD
jgi:hypothetical protein